MISPAMSAACALNAAPRSNLRRAPGKIRSDAKRRTPLEGLMCVWSGRITEITKQVSIVIRCGEDLGWDYRHKPKLNGAVGGIGRSQQLLPPPSPLLAHCNRIQRQGLR